MAKVVGILGGGQLALMLAQAGKTLGIGCRYFTEEPGTPARSAAEEWVGKFSNPEDLKRFASGCDLVTYEWENIPIEGYEALEASGVSVFPNPKVLAMAQSRATQKTFFRDAGVLTAPFREINHPDDLASAVKEIGLPGILKTNRYGYDGKGQVRLTQSSQVATAFGELGGVPCVYEGFVDFERELSLVAVRSKTKELAFYPLVQNEHCDGILRVTVAPAGRIDVATQAKAESYAATVFEAFDYVGVLTLELFQKGNELFVNELATRVHNTGHWSIEGTECSQFENHLRAGFGMPLGDTSAKGFSAMLNLIGDLPKGLATKVEPGYTPHLYGKSPRAGRKLGHLTLVEKSALALKEKLTALRAKLGI